METVERAVVIGSPDLETLTTSHVERVFLTVRQELKRFQRKGLGYSKDLETHKHAVALFLGVYNFVRKHKTLRMTLAVAAGVEFEAWTLERVVDMTAAYMRRKEDAEFEKAFAAAGIRKLLPAFLEPFLHFFGAPAAPIPARGQFKHHMVHPGKFILDAISENFSSYLAGRVNHEPVALKVMPPTN